jgi:asparagine synthase (glutamine-hydrolysing)
VHDPHSLGSIKFYKTCSDHGAVNLYGQGGDEIFPKTWLSTQLSYQGWSQALIDFYRSIFRHQVFPRLGTGVLVGLRKFVRPGISPAAAAFPDWLRPEFARKLSLLDRWALVRNRKSQTVDPLDALATPPQRRFVTPLWDGLLSACDMGQHGVPIETRLPYLDLRVVAFGLGLPRMPWSCHKELLRRLGTTLPKEITSRPKTPLRGDPLGRRLQRNKELVLKLAQLPLVPLLEEMICADRWRRSFRETSFEMWPLWESLRVVSLNYWLQRNATTK